MKTIASIFGAIVALAVIALIISKKSQAPQAIQAASSGIASIVAAAVNPATAAPNNGDLGLNPFTAPANATSSGLPGLPALPDFASMVQ